MKKKKKNKQKKEKRENIKQKRIERKNKKKREGERRESRKKKEKKRENKHIKKQKDKAEKKGKIGKIIISGAEVSINNKKQYISKSFEVKHDYKPKEFINCTTAEDRLAAEAGALNYIKQGVNIAFGFAMEALGLQVGKMVAKATTSNVFWQGAAEKQGAKVAGTTLIDMLFGTQSALSLSDSFATLNAAICDHIDENTEKILNEIQYGIHTLEGAMKEINAKNHYDHLSEEITTLDDYFKLDCVNAKKSFSNAKKGMKICLDDIHDIYAINPDDKGNDCKVENIELYDHVFNQLGGLILGGGYNTDAFYYYEQVLKSRYNYNTQTFNDPSC